MTIKFRINLEALYNKVGPNLKYGTYIRKQNRFGNEQYTLLEAPPECNPKGILLRDKEECVLLRAIDNQVLLKCEGRNQTFCLTPQEFEIAAFVCDEQEIITEKATAFCNDVALHFAYKLRYFMLAAFLSMMGSMQGFMNHQCLFWRHMKKS